MADNLVFLHKILWIGYVAGNDGILACRLKDRQCRVANLSIATSAIDIAGTGIKLIDPLILFEDHI